MTPCFSYRARDLLALLLGACLLPGCVDPKTVGLETDDERSAESSEGGQTDGMTSQGSGSDSGGQTEGSDGPETCPPIDHADCVACECIEGEWSCSSDACVYDCSDHACGDACMMCPEGDPECSSPEHEGVCTTDGECVGVPPPELGFCEGALAPGFEAGLSEAGGCSDMVVYGYDAADTQAVLLVVDDGLVADAVASGMPVHAEYEATDPALTLEARAGQQVTAGECQDVPVPGVQVDETWRPTAGTVIVDVVPSGSEGVATVEFVDLVLEREQPGPGPLTVPSLIIADVLVGWFPG